MVRKVTGHTSKEKQLPTTEKFSGSQNGKSENFRKVARLMMPASVVQDLLGSSKNGIVSNNKTALVQRIREVDKHSGIGNFHDPGQLSGLRECSKKRMSRSKIHLSSRNRARCYIAAKEK